MHKTISIYTQYQQQQKLSKTMALFRDTTHKTTSTISSIKPKQR